MLLEHAVSRVTLAPLRSKNHETRLLIIELVAPVALYLSLLSMSLAQLTRWSWLKPDAYTDVFDEATFSIVRPAITDQRMSKHLNRA
jgi:hypothetical protein